jgi:hypothetical protein
MSCRKKAQVGIGAVSKELKGNVVVFQLDGAMQGRAAFVVCRIYIDQALDARQVARSHSIVKFGHLEV